MIKRTNKEYNIFLKCLIRDMETSLRDRIRYYPRDDDIIMLEEIKTKLARKMKECPTCDGDGQVQGEVDYDNNDIPIWNLEKCPQCKGTGEVI